MSERPRTSVAADHGSAASQCVSDTPELSIVVVSYNTRELTIAALRSVLVETRATTFEVIVVDNASTDGSVAAIDALDAPIRLIANDVNLGFAAANNQAAMQARGSFLLLLNPDTEIVDGAIDRLMSFQRQRPDAGIWGGRTVFADGSLNPSSAWRRITLWNLFCRTAMLTGSFPRSPLFNSEAYGGWGRAGERAVDIVSGCFLLITARLWHQLGGFDPSFFMYGEEADLCLRARRFGASPLSTGSATIVHHGGRSERSRADKVIRLLAAKSLLIHRHLPGWQRGAGLFLLAAWPLSRWFVHRMAAAGSTDHRHATEAAVWRSVFRARRQWLAGYPSKVAPPAELPAALSPPSSKRASHHAV